jgi:tetratricopeptide (TPR) repeat protein
MLDARKGGELVRRRAWLLGRMDRHDEAIELLSETISATGDAATADLLALSDAFDLAGDPASALAVLERVLPADPDYQLAARRRVRIHLDRGEAGLAAEAALSARQVLPLEQVDGRAALLELAVQARVDQSSFDRAEALIGELEPLDADRAHRALGLVLTGRGLDAEAIELEEEAIVLEPSELAHRTRLARLLVDSGASEAAVATLDAAIASVEARRDALLADASPDLAWSAVEQARGTVAWLLLRRSFIEKDAGLPERSEASLRALLELYPRHGEGMNALAYLWAEEDRNLDEATELVSRAVEQRPYSGAFADTVGWILYRQGRHAEAVEQLRRALDLLPGDDPEVLDHLADALRAAGQHDEALRSWRAVLALLADLDDPSRRAGDVERIEGKIRQLEAQVEAGE